MTGQRLPVFWSQLAGTRKATPKPLPLGVAVFFCRRKFFQASCNDRPFFSIEIASGRFSGHVAVNVASPEVN